MSTIRKIKADAQIAVTVGTPFIGSLQAAMIWIMEQLSDEQRAELEQGLHNNQYLFDEPVINHAVTLLMLVRNIEKKVTDDGLFVEEPVTPQEN